MKSPITFISHIKYADSSPFTIRVDDDYDHASLSIHVARFSEPVMFPPRLPDFCALQTTLSVHLHHPTACRLLADEMERTVASLRAMAEKMDGLAAKEVSNAPA